MRLYRLSAWYFFLTILPYQMTIPKNGGGNFDINAFAVHVMSVDYTHARYNNNNYLFITLRWIICAVIIFILVHVSAIFYKKC